MSCTQDHALAKQESSLVCSKVLRPAANVSYAKLVAADIVPSCVAQQRYSNLSKCNADGNIVLTHAKLSAVLATVCCLVFGEEV